MNDPDSSSDALDEPQSVWGGPMSLEGPEAAAVPEMSSDAEPEMAGEAEAAADLNIPGETEAITADRDVLSAAEATAGLDEDTAELTIHGEADTSAGLEIPGHAQSQRRGRVVVAIPSLLPHGKEDYQEIHSDVVERIVGEVVNAERKELFFQVEFRDGRHDIVSFEELLDLENGPDALSEHQDGSEASSTAQWGVKRKRYETESHISESESPGDDGESLSDEIDYEVPRSRPRRRTLRVRQHPNTLSNWILKGETTKDNRAARELRPRRITSLTPHDTADDIDELAEDPPPQPVSSDDDDEDFQLVRSDLAPSRPKRKSLRKRSKRLKISRTKTAPRDHSRGSSIEFEHPRRSGRTTRRVGAMRDPNELDSFYVTDDETRDVTNAAVVKEVFKTLPEDSKFVKFHMSVCLACDRGPSQGKGSLVYCQGCTVSYHKMCIGIRQTREHIVTKVGDDDFVLQCRFCIGRATAKDATAPRQSMCQVCRKDGLACAAFSVKKTSKQEEAIRKENDGVDPITPVPANLVNNADNILFRCTGCRRPWHIEHLPSIRVTESDLNFRDERLAEYAVDFKCEECSSMRDKPQTLVAWRPTKAVTEPSWPDINEDDKEYLVKWDGRSYFHCSWMPGAWVFGVCTGNMRSAFGRRDAQKGLMRTSQEEAVPQEYVLADVILLAKHSKSAPHASTKEEAMARISYVTKIYVKFQGLSYDDVVWDDPPSKGSPLYPAFEAAYAEYLNGLYFQSDSTSRMKERAKQFKAQSFKEEIELDEQPPGLRGKLMKYQLQGVNWMLHRYHQEQNAILADEMGLGKTVQVVALISTLVFDNPRCWPFLIVVPNATCANWRREIKFWRPELRVVTYYGGRHSQELAYNYELFPNGNELTAHVVVMSYDSAQDDRTRGLFRSVSWAGLVVDEGQRLKNDSNLLYRALQAMHFPFRLLLTGTPLQNNKRELFNLLHFVDRRYDAIELDERFETLTAEKLRELHSLISPYFYRRTKVGVLKFLPGMAQVIVPVSMTVLQEKLCKSIMAKSPDLIRSVFANGKLRLKDRGSLNNILMQLRKCLCHPFIYSDAIEERNVDPERLHRNLVEASGKLLLLEPMLLKLQEQGHRVLIFSQFLNQLDIIEDFMTGMGMSFRRLDGSMSSLEKQRRIDAYNAPGSDIFAFLLSTRAGGVGINLATADTVIIMDPDFNPHQDMQALSRAHRIGQNRPVLCFQLMTRHSVEEKIMQVGKKKMALDHALIERMDTEDAPEDLEGVLRFGAEALFDENEKEVIRYDNAAIEKLLDRSQADKPEVDESEEANFSYGRIWSAEKGAIDEDGLEESDNGNGPTALPPSVWDAILAEREAEAERVRLSKVEVLGRGSRRRQNVNYRANASQLIGLEPGDLSESDLEDLEEGQGEDYNEGSDRGEDDAMSEEADDWGNVKSDIATIRAADAAEAPGHRGAGKRPAPDSAQRPQPKGRPPADPAKAPGRRGRPPNPQDVANKKIGRQWHHRQPPANITPVPPPAVPQHYQQWGSSPVAHGFPGPPRFLQPPGQGHGYDPRASPTTSMPSMPPSVHPSYYYPAPAPNLASAQPRPNARRGRQSYIVPSGRPYQYQEPEQAPEAGRQSHIINSLPKSEVRIALDNIKHSVLDPLVRETLTAGLKRRLAELEGREN